MTKPLATFVALTGEQRLAKHVGRDPFGFRNPINQRRRIRWSCTRQNRRLTARTTVLPG